MKRKTKMALAGGIGITAIIAFLLTPVLLLVLAGCDTAESSEPSRESCSDVSAMVRQCELTLNDTRKVNCLIYHDHRKGGMSCDWDHASGADKEPQ
ncbi:hypothetical protein [Bifidobacterium moukalabense]|jgi:hypothetical protein|uniref:hypothetical protein n=1 Tax=Bifidobacterium moukalabense TaxID=1333651 RepID=UPI0010F5FB87|nr:hypothetical protein [Bifidobacterium moukalabense]